MKTGESGRRCLKALSDPSPLVRSAAAESLAGNPSIDAAHGLVNATKDDSRLVRIRSAAALAGFPSALLKDQDVSSVNKATEEFLASLTTRPDQWTSHYNLGNYHLNRGQLATALEAFEKASKLNPEGVQPLVNVSIVHARMSELRKAEASLVNALHIDPRSAPANFNMGLLKAEQGDVSAAEKYLRKAFEHDPQRAEAAYNLAVILSRDRMGEAVTWARKAAELRPGRFEICVYAWFLLLPEW